MHTDKSKSMAFTSAGSMDIASIHERTAFAFIPVHLRSSADHALGQSEA
jgi:hypothetical protein